MVGGSGLERTCRLKPILGWTASPNVALIGPKYRLRGHSRGARWENLVGGACVRVDAGGFEALRVGDEAGGFCKRLSLYLPVTN